MSSKEPILCNKEHYCVTLARFREKTRELSKEEAKIAEEAKQGALEILQDALKKKDKVLMKVPERIVLKGKERQQFWIERHAILTEDVVKKLLAELKKVTFKKNVYMCREVTFAYVHMYEPNTIFLCSNFWKRKRYLERDSQPGTVINEVSQFLGTKDITYAENTLSVGYRGYIVKGSPAHSKANSPPKENFWEALEKAFWNAKNIQHEFELTINHSKKYVNGKYPCCGETKRYSVCEKSVPDFFHTSNISKKWETEKLLINNIIQRKKSNPFHLRWLHETVEEMGESLRNVKVTDKEYYGDALWKAFWNAEFTLNHKGNYVAGKNSCYEETGRYSMCDQSVPNSFHTCRFVHMWESKTLVKKLCERSGNIEGKLREHHRIVGEMEESLRKAKTSREACLSMDLVGAATLTGGLLLAPATLGLSALVAGGVGLTGARVAKIFMRNFKARATTKKKELGDIFAECQSFLDDVKRVIASLNYEAEFWKDLGVQCCSYCYLEYITILIDLIMKQVESKRNDMQKIHRYMGGVIQCAHLLESLSKILFE